MLRRSALVVTIVGALAVAPLSASPAPYPLPTAGLANLSICNHIACGSTSEYLVGNFTFLGAISLDGGSYRGTFRIDFAAFGCFDLACKLRIDGTVRQAPFSVGVSTVDIVPVSFGGAIEGPCGGVIAPAQLISRLSCSFTTGTGLSGMRQIVVTHMLDVTDVPCDFFCSNPSSNIDTRYNGAYAGAIGL